MRKSRRWLLASSMGASAALAAGAVAEAAGARPTRTPRPASLQLPTPSDCEKDYAVPVPKLDDWLTEPATPAAKKQYLADAIEYGFGFNHKAGGTALPNFHAVAKSHLLDAYEEGIDGGEIGTRWAMSVAQAFILGQLTYHFWKKAVTADPAKDKLKFRHLASAWAVFGKATSSCWCAKWVKGAPGSKDAYVLPRLPTAAGAVKMFQVDEPCALCA